ncbi:MAG: ABC transporter substrate-binding protein [Flavobacteriales bacterium]|nr:ABC transporter substrate-binding protein [Flavobacteriales bacterium]MDG1780619.1 ABC transporter substrate-binding protein [Flavobacteriales bacterium]MDG2244960.1 ABC transporter substrate-binding protein [Flavobacteriales bacterium]
MRYFAFALAILLCACSGEDQTVRPASQLNEVKKTEFALGFDFQTVNDVTSLRLYDLVGDGRNCFLNVSYEPISKNEDGVNYVVIDSLGSFATLSTTHLSYFSAINTLDQVAGTAYAEWVKSPKARKAIDNGEIIDISGEKDVDFEKVVILNTQALLTYPYGNTDYSLLEKAGVAIIPCSEYLEEHPLGRAEWVKVIGFLTGQEKAANALFEAIRDEYMSLSTLKNSLKTDELPEVFTGSHSNGKWYAPTRTSFIAKFITDAGGHYLFENDPLNESTAAGENLEMDFEVFMTKAAKADFWGKVVYEEEGLNYRSIQDEDPRYEGLRAFQEEGIFYCNASTTDYFGDAMLEPHLILKDLIHILHPHAMQHDSVYTPHYFKGLERE